MAGRCFIFTMRELKGYRNCSKCKKYLKLDSSNFYGDKSRPYGFRSYCKLCSETYKLNWRSKNRHKVNKQKRKWHRKNPEAMRRYDLQKVGITSEQYDALEAKQQKLCAICGVDDPGKGKKNFCVDHSHLCCPKRKSCGKCLRGLLCSSCNLAVGLLKDSLSRAEAVVRYLKEYETSGEIKSDM